MAEIDEKGVKAQATRVRSKGSRWSDNDLDKLATATAVALGACADILADLAPSEVPRDEIEKRLNFLRVLAQEVQTLGIPF